MDSCLHSITALEGELVSKHCLVLAMYNYIRDQILGHRVYKKYSRAGVGKLSPLPLFLSIKFYWTQLCLVVYLLYFYYT